MEQLTGAPVLVEPHGFFSAGTLLGALLGILLTSTRFPGMEHCPAAAAISAPLEFAKGNCWVRCGAPQK